MNSYTTVHEPLSTDGIMHS